MQVTTVRALRPKKIRDAYRAALVAVTCVLLVGCNNLKPWVAPYERNLLAEPVMSFERDPVAGSYMHHVFQAREGARGAEGGGGGGCGCN